MSIYSPWKTYSIFISSTFADMQAERDHLKNFVLPRVREELQKKRIKLEIVDLRWGLDTTSIEQEDEREVTVLKVCLDEIERCKPFFICLLGDRYGWIPPKKRMEDATIGLKNISTQKGKSVTALEIEFGVLASDEQLIRSAFYVRNPLDYSKFSPKRAAMFSDALNLNISESERKERVLALKKLVTSINSYFEEKKLENKVKSYEADWDSESEKVINLEKWGNIVYEDIINDCIEHAKYTIDSIPKNWQENEIALLDSFIENHTITFCGRENLLKDLKTHLLSKEQNNWGMILTGESGSGKSAVFAMVNKIMQNDDCFILSHSAGLSAKSRNIADLLKIWNMQLRIFLGHEVTETSQNENSDIETLVEKFKELVSLAVELKQVVLLIDALDRFEQTERAMYMTWLPNHMPQGIRMLCTAITGFEENAIEFHSHITKKSIDFFTTNESKLMLNMLCKLKHKNIPTKVESVILNKKRDDGLSASSSPLWLSLATNILMAMDNDDFEKMSILEGRGDEVIVDYMESLVNDFPAYPGSLFLSLIVKATSVFDESFTINIFNFIACSRNGLREMDLEKLISKSKNKNWDSLQFANLRRWFNKHLRIEGENKQWNLVHSILRNSLIENLDNKVSKNIHNSIAMHLLSLTADDDIRVSETMYQLMKAKNIELALDYYISDLTDSEIDGATTVLSYGISSGEEGLKWIASLINEASKVPTNIWKLASRINYNLNEALSIDGNLESRINIFNEIKVALQDTKVDLNTNVFYGNNFMSLLEKLGSAYKTIGQINNALDCYNNYFGIAKALYKNNPQNNDYLSNLSISNERLGEIYQLYGELDQALQFYSDYSFLIKKLLETNTKNEAYQNNYASSFDKLGEIYQIKGQNEHALQCYTNANILISELFQNNPENDYYKSNLAVSYDKLGDISKASNNLDQALEYYRSYSNLFSELYESNPKNESFKKGLALSFFKAGAIYQESHQFDVALNFFNQYYILTKELFEDNPQDLNHKNNYAISFERLGEIYLALEDYDQALKLLHSRNNLAIELSESNPENVSLTSSLITSYEKLAMVYKSIGETAEALNYYLLKYKLANELYGNNQDNLNIGFLLGGSHYELGTIYLEINQEPEAKIHFIEALHIFDQLYNNTQQEVYAKYSNQARNVIDQLEAAGY